MGDIPSFREAEYQEIVEREDGSWLVDGSTPVFEFKELLDIREMPGEDDGSYTTLGGFVITQLGRMPAVGDRFEAASKRYEVVDMDRNRVDKILVSEAPEPADGAGTDEES